MKRLLAILMVLVVMFSLTGCEAFGNKDWFDTVCTFKYAMIMLPNGEIVEGEVESWSDYEDGDQLRITFVNGNTYLTSTFNAVLMVDIPEVSDELS